MKEDSDYQKTIAFLCKDLIFLTEDIAELEDENDLLNRITEAIINQGDEDLFHTGNLERHLTDYSVKLLAVYSRNPSSTRLDSLYRRSESIRNMCSDLLAGRT